MSLCEISGQNAFSFMTHFDYIRQAGTAGETTAAAALTKQIGALGLSVETEPFEIPMYSIETAELTVLAPYEKTYPVAGYFRSGDTPENGIEAPFLYAEDGNDLALSQANGKIVLVNGPLFPPLYEKLIKSGAKAFLTVVGTPVDTNEDRILFSRELRFAKRPKQKEMDKAAAPGGDKAAAPGEDETPVPGGILHIIDAAEMVEKGAGTVRFCLKQREEKAVCYNIVCHIPGTDPVMSRERLVLSAHYDSGCAIIYEVCKYFKEHPAKRSLDFVWFSAEERGLLGSKAYAKRHEEELQNCRMNLNVDLAGQCIGSTVFGVTADDEVNEVIRSIAKKNGRGVTIKNQVWSSDSNSFAAKGVPAATLDRDGYGMHTRHDTLDLISPWSLERDARLLCAIAEELGNADEFPFARHMKEEYLTRLNP